MAVSIVFEFFSLFFFFFFFFFSASKLGNVSLASSPFVLPLSPTKKKMGASDMK